MKLDAIKPYAKAVMAGVVAAAGAVATGYADETLSQGEIWMAVSAGLTAAGATWVIPNRDPKAQHQLESVQPPHVGDEHSVEVPADGKQYDVEFDGMGARISNPQRDPLDAPNEDYEPGGRVTSGEPLELPPGTRIMRHDP